MTKGIIISLFFGSNPLDSIRPAPIARRILPFLAFFLLLSWASQLRAECNNSFYVEVHNLIINATAVAGVINGSLSDDERIMYKVNIAKDCKLIFNWSCSGTTSFGMQALVGSTHFFTIEEDQCWGWMTYNGSEGFFDFNLCDPNTAEGTKSMFVGPQTLYIYMSAGGGGWDDVGGGVYTINLSSVPAIENSTETEWNDSKDTADIISGNEIRGSVGFANKRDLTSAVTPANAEITHDPADWYTAQVGASGTVAVQFAWQDNVGRGEVHGVTITLSGESKAGGEVTQSAPLSAQGKLKLQNLVPKTQYYVSVAADQVTTWAWKDEFGAYVMDIGEGNGEGKLGPVYFLLLESE